MKRPFIQLWVADYLADTGHLNAAEHGAYLLLIFHYWTNGGLPTDETAIQRISRMTTRQWAKSRDTLKSLFRDGWKHKRVDEELAKVIEKSQTNSANALAGHRRRRELAEFSHQQSHSQSDSESKSDAVAKRQTTASLISDGAHVFAKHIMDAWGIDQNDPRAIGTAYTAQRWLDHGWRQDLTVETIRRVASKKTPLPQSLKYFEQAIADAHAELARPIASGISAARPPPRQRGQSYLDIAQQLSRQAYDHEQDHYDYDH